MVTLHTTYQQFYFGRYSLSSLVLDIIEVFGYFQGKSIINYVGINFLNDICTLIGIKNDTFGFL